MDRGFATKIVCMTSTFLNFAGELFAVLPIKLVTLADKHPLSVRQNPNGDWVGAYYYSEKYEVSPPKWMWVASHAGGNYHYNLPISILERMDEFRPPESSRYGSAICETSDSARDALSNACVRFGRGLVGLPCDLEAYLRNS